MKDLKQKRPFNLTVNMTDNQNINTTASRYRTKKVVAIALLSALAFAFNALSQLLPPIFPVPPLGYDPKDIVIVLGGFLLGPLSAVLIAVISCTIELSISSTGLIGLLMNIVSSVAFSFTASAVYKLMPNFKGAILGMTAAVLVATPVMILWNWLITPLYVSVPRAAIVNWLAPIFLPFNLIKGSVNAVGVLIAYKPIMHALKRYFFIKPSVGNNK